MSKGDRNMRLAALIVMLIALVPAPVLAAEMAEMPDMVGEWTGTSRAVVSGAGGHYGEVDVLPQFVEAELTIEWTQQKDNRLIGTITSAEGTEPKLGVLSSNGMTLMTADTDGASLGRIIDEDHFELCYVQTSLGDDQIVVSCVDFARVIE